MKDVINKSDMVNTDNLWTRQNTYSVTCASLSTWLYVRTESHEHERVVNLELRTVLAFTKESRQGMLRMLSNTLILFTLISRGITVQHPKIRFVHSPINWMSV